MRWWTYQNKEINLSSEFIALDKSGQEISITVFFQQMNTGQYIPVRLEDRNNKHTYQLTQLGPEADPGIKEEIIILSQKHCANYKKIGTEFPEFRFTDVQGNTYKKESVAGKTLIIKSWFIGCAPCIAEFPELNELVREDRDDVIFISLALDSEEKLLNFLQKKPFSYKVVPNQRQFINDQLKVSDYPTHIVVSPDGTYEIVPDNSKRLIAYLKKTLN